MSRKREIVKWFQRLKGYGFAETESRKVDVFTNYTVDTSSDSFRHLFDSQENRLEEQMRDKRA